MNDTLLAYSVLFIIIFIILLTDISRQAHLRKEVDMLQKEITTLKADFSDILNPALPVWE